MQQIPDTRTEGLVEQEKFSSLTPYYPVVPLCRRSLAAFGMTCCVLIPIDVVRVNPLDLLLNPYICSFYVSNYSI